MFEAIAIDNQIGHFVQHWQQRYETQKRHHGILSDQDAKALLPQAEQALFMLDGLIDIIDDLNYDKEKFESLIFKLDDDYELLRDFRKSLSPVILSHAELGKLSDEILDKLMKAQRELGLVISAHEHQNM